MKVSASRDHCRYTNARPLQHRKTAVNRRWMLSWLRERFNYPLQFVFAGAAFYSSGPEQSRILNCRSWQLNLGFGFPNRLCPLFLSIPNSTDIDSRHKANVSKAISEFVTTNYGIIPDNRSRTPLNGAYFCTMTKQMHFCLWFQRLLLDFWFPIACHIFSPPPSPTFPDSTSYWSPKIEAMTAKHANPHLTHSNDEHFENDDCETNDGNNCNNTWIHIDLHSHS